MQKLSINNKINYIIVDRCPLCSSPGKLIFSDLVDDRYNSKGTYSIDFCEKCNFAFLKNRLPEDIIKSYYNIYYPYKDLRLFNFNFYNKKNIFFNFLRFLDGNLQLAYFVQKNQKALDYGCGDGTGLVIMSYLGAIPYGYEIDARCKEFLIHNGFKIINLESTTELDESINWYFDVIILNQVLEHLYDPLETLNRLSKLLKNNGKIILSFPNLDSFWRKLLKNNWIHWHVPYHINFFSEKSIKILVSKTNLKIKRIINVTPTQWSISNLIKFLYIKIFNKNKLKFNLDFPIFLRILSIPLNHLLNFFSKGDALICILEKNEY